jgi:hypothetical protein
MDKQTDREMEEWTKTDKSYLREKTIRDRWADRQTDRWKNRQMDEQTDG